MGQATTAVGIPHCLNGWVAYLASTFLAQIKRSDREKMEETDRPTCERTIEDQPAEGQDRKEELTWTEIDIEEVAIDGICGVY
jgi:mycofactocin precursor